ncbi:MAG: creatininase family protein, partial [Defluviitaleaceae bacterium]|nr:creatininase family protein [Defluviitaleaceae bacterium]
MMHTSVYYEELTPNEFRARIVEMPVAYLPLGTLEWHGEHLPLGADGLQSRGFFSALAKKIGGIVLPMLFLGPDRQAEIGGKEYYGMDTFAEDASKAYVPPAPYHVPQTAEKGKLPMAAQLPGSAYWIEQE